MVVKDHDLGSDLLTYIPNTCHVVGERMNEVQACKRTTKQFDH
jgi:hypothetical protein